MRSHRRVSCRDLGAGECDGWLWKKKTNATSPLTSKWSKKWVVLKDNALYCYHTEEDDKAESYIYLPGYKIIPASESKKKFAFRVAHPERKTFFFASDRQIDMTRWMNKMGLAAIEYTFPKEDNHTTKDDNYFSESDSEDASNTSQSETESGTQTPNSSPEKPLRTPQNVVPSATPPRNRTGRHMSTQPDLNRSARYPRNKAELLKSSATTQTTDSLQREVRDRSNSESNHHSKAIVDTESNGNNSPVTSPRKSPVVSPENRKHKTDDARRKQYRNSTQQSTNIETDGVKASHSEAELKHLKQVASKKAEEVAKRESLLSASTAASGDSQDSVEGTGMFGKIKKHTKKSSVISPNKDAVGVAQDDRTVHDNLPSPRGRRDIAGRPKVTTESGQVNEEVLKAENGSMDDLCKALQNADIDIRGVSRKATLKRRVTILSRDPKRNDLLLRKRALQRQIKAREGELEYIKLLDDQVITSELIHDWINQHQSFFAELGTIRRLSKRKKSVNKVAQGGTKEKLTDGKDPRETVSSSTPDASKPMPPVPAKRASLLLSDSTAEDVFKSLNDDHHKSSDSELLPSYPPAKSLPLESKVRPRSWAISVSDSEKVKARSSQSVSPHHEVHKSSLSSELDNYLETDL